MEDLSGQRFGRLVVVQLADYKKGTPAKYICRCDCGKEVTVRAAEMKRGRTKSCGCYRRDVSRSQLGKVVKHGLSHSPLYSVWCGIKRRCLNPNHPAYSSYGGRGITICKEWENDFVKFYQWSITHGYKKGLTIDRIDNDKDYSPTNCRYTTPKVQANNRRDNTHIVYKGQDMTVPQCEDMYGVPRSTLYGRIAIGLKGDALVEMTENQVRRWRKSNAQ